MYGKEESVIKEKKVGSPVKKMRNPCCMLAECLQRCGESRVDFFGGRVDKGREEEEDETDRSRTGEEKVEGSPRGRGKERKKEEDILPSPPQREQRMSRKGCQEKKRKGAVAIVVL